MARCGRSCRCLAKTIAAFVHLLRMAVRRHRAVAIPGGDGNREFFIAAHAADALLVQP